MKWVLKLVHVPWVGRNTRSGPRRTSHTVSITIRLPVLTRALSRSPPEERWAAKLSLTRLVGRSVSLTYFVLCRYSCSGRIWPDQFSRTIYCCSKDQEDLKLEKDSHTGAARFPLTVLQSELCNKSKPWYGLCLSEVFHCLPIWYHTISRSNCASCNWCRLLTVGTKSSKLRSAHEVLVRPVLPNWVRHSAHTCYISAKDVEQARYGNVACSSSS